jgi:hypothetical protein
MKYSADLTINVHKKCEISTKIEISTISIQKYWHAKIFLYINHTKPEIFPNFPEVICGRIFMKLGPIKAELNEVFRSIYKYIHKIISNTLIIVH